jgi:hypothetical protein
MMPGAVEAQVTPSESTKSLTPQPSRLASDLPGGSTAATSSPRDDSRDAVALPALVATVPPQETRRSQNIDQLLEQLQDLRNKKAELDKQEKELLATLKDKLKEQKQRLDKLGVRLEESPVLPRIEIPV